MSKVKELVPLRHGHWQNVKFEDGVERIIALRCSACGDWFDLDYTDQEDEFKYCPLCGARMDEPSETKYAKEKRVNNGQL